MWLGDNPLQEPLGYPMKSSRQLTTVIHADGVIDLAIVILVTVVGARGCLVLGASLLSHKSNLDLKR